MVCAGRWGSTATHCVDKFSSLRSARQLPFRFRTTASAFPVITKSVVIMLSFRPTALRCASLRRASRRDVSPSIVPPWLDILIRREDVLRIVDVLYLGQSIVRRRAVGGANAIFAFANSKVVNVDAAREGLHRGPELAGPGNVWLSVGWIRPARNNCEVVLGVAVRKRGRVRTNPPDGAAQVLDQQHRRGRRRLAEAIHDCFDRAIAQPGQKMGAPVDLEARRKHRIHRALELDVAHWPHQVRDRRSKGAKRLDRGFAGGDWPTVAYEHCPDRESLG